MPLSSANMPLLWQILMIPRMSSCEELSKLLKSVPKTDKHILLGDVNARVGKDINTWPGLTGQYGTERATLMEHSFCRSATTLSSDWVVPLRKNPQGKHWHMTDYVIVQQKDADDVCWLKFINFNFKKSIWTHLTLMKTGRSSGTPSTSSHWLY